MEVVASVLLQPIPGNRMSEVIVPVRVPVVPETTSYPDKSLKFTATKG
jgi:hypothetical protein